jgi:hypothetical protein
VPRPDLRGEKCKKEFLCGQFLSVPG